MKGRVTDEPAPQISLEIGGRMWTSLVDTGFNGDFELPAVLKDRIPAQYVGPVASNLAGGQTIIEESYVVDVKFDGETVAAEVTFVEEDGVLIGTRILRNHRLEIDFPARTVRLERAG